MIVFIYLSVCLFNLLYFTIAATSLRYKIICLKQIINQKISLFIHSFI